MTITSGYINKIKIRTQFDEQGPSALIYLNDGQYFWLWSFSRGSPTIDKRYDGLALLSLVRDAFINKFWVKITHHSTSTYIRTLEIKKEYEPSLMDIITGQPVLTEAHLRMSIDSEFIP